MPKLYIVQDENKAYFDINSAVLSCPPQDLVVNSKGISEILVKQFSSNPNIVRVVIKYSEDFNPSNIQLKRVANTFLVRFKTTQAKNFYFQHVYADSTSSVNEVYEDLKLQIPVLAGQTMANQINSAFKLGSTTEDKNYILSKKDLILPTMFYLDDITVRNGKILISGAGTYLLSKPVYLSNPSRVVYDIPNAILNSALRNREFYISENETIKAGQFDKRTVRLVITTQDKNKFIPVYSADNQRFAFVNSTAFSSPYQTPKSVMTTLYDEINGTATHSVKIIFSKPIEYSIIRESKSLDLYFHNAEKSQDIKLSFSTILSGAKFTALKNGGTKFSIPLLESDTIDVHTGIDAKSMRVRISSAVTQLPVSAIAKPDNKEFEKPEKPDHKGKIYVVIDPGHGGSDCGALRGSIQEKNITLDVSKRVE
jgi:N-acetylmuramoyl-L-alanine amidase